MTSSIKRLSHILVLQLIVDVEAVCIASTHVLLALLVMILRIALVLELPLMIDRHWLGR